MTERPEIDCPIALCDDRAATALAIWSAAVTAADPAMLVMQQFVKEYDQLVPLLDSASRILVVGAGKASGAMAHGLERVFENREHLIGIVNVPDGTTAITDRIRLNPARPAGSNHPTEAGVRGAEEMLALLQSAGPNDVAFCLISGGGSALLPAPAVGITLEDKQQITKWLHASGATINEMNAVRKHVSRIKGGRLAEAFRGKFLISFIISDVVGDPLDVIASGPTVIDPTTYADAIGVLTRYDLLARTPAAIRTHLQRGVRGDIPETLKVLPETVRNVLIGSNTQSLDAASQEATRRGYTVVDLGPFIEGETREVAVVVAGTVRNIRSRGKPVPPPACILIGGETTVTLNANPGKGGRNQEFALAMLAFLGTEGMRGVTVLSAGTDGEDGPTDAAGAIATYDILQAAERQGFSLTKHLDTHDAYPLFAATGGLIRSGLTGTNVTDVRVILVS